MKIGYMTEDLRNMKKTIKAFFPKSNENYKKIQEKRTKNTSKYHTLNVILVILFPVFLSAICEIIQMQSIGGFFLFLIEKPMIFLFNVLICSMLLFAFFLLFKKAYLATFLVGATLGTFSVIEFFKFQTSGMHFTVTDLAMVANPSALGELTDFASYISITPLLVISVISIFAYMGAVFWFNPILEVKLPKRLMASVVAFVVLVSFVSTPSIAIPVYSFFDIDTTKTENYVVLNNKFKNNNFLAFLSQTTTETLSKDIEKPNDYSLNLIQAMLTIDENEIPSSVKAPIKPNVITIMSEAYADFRVFEELEISEDIYSSLDDILNNSYSGKTIVPTFAGFTVKTEFELMFGLPIKSINDVDMPQMILNENEQNTIFAKYKDLGYSTNYVHTFNRNFYGRDEIYSRYSIDNMYFSDNLTVPIEHYRDYISDKTVFNQIAKILEDEDKPVYLHATTMQNHQPYENEEMSQFELYLNGVKIMLDDLKEFLVELEKFDEPTIVLFVGDHFPALGNDNTVYDTLILDGDNANKLYEQSFFIWDNYDVDYSQVPNETFSIFYLPHLIMQATGQELSQVSNTIIEKVKESPIYSSSLSVEIEKDDVLDAVVYDQVFGENFIENE